VLLGSMQVSSVSASRNVIICAQFLEIGFGAALQDRRINLSEYQSTLCQPLLQSRSEEQSADIETVDNGGLAKK
jgi:hypothetical protein